MKVFNRPMPPIRILYSTDSRLARKGLTRIWKKIGTIASRPFKGTWPLDEQGNGRDLLIAILRFYEPADRIR